MSTPMPDWTFWADATTGAHKPFGQLAVNGFTCNWVLSGFGSAEAIIPVSQSTALTRTDLLGLYKWRLWALYRGVPVWGGLATGLMDEGGDAVTVALTELPGYLMRKVWAQQVVYGAVDQTAIAADIAGRLDNVGVPRLITASEPAEPAADHRVHGWADAGDLLLGLAGSPTASVRSEYSLTGADASLHAASTVTRWASPARAGAAGAGGPVVQAQWSWT
jgi:hypothetical protein